MVTPQNPPRPHLVPTSSPSEGRPQKSTSSLVPLPYGGRGRTGVQNTTPTTTPHLVPGTRSKNTTTYTCPTCRTTLTRRQRHRCLPKDGRP